MKFKELKNKSENELKRILSESRESSRELRFKIASKQLKNVRETRVLKGTVARVLTLLNKKSVPSSNDSKQVEVKPEIQADKK